VEAAQVILVATAVLERLPSMLRPVIPETAAPMEMVAKHTQTAGACLVLDFMETE
jgi:hypothetical protein